MELVEMAVLGQTTNNYVKMFVGTKFFDKFFYVLATVCKIHTLIGTSKKFHPHSNFSSIHN